MPHKDKGSVLIRQWELLKLLPSAGTGKTVKELTIALNEAGYPISKRQVERDLDVLFAAFVLDRDDRSNPHGWKWAKGVSLNLPAMTVPEAMSLHLVEETIKPLLPTSMLEGLDTRFRQAEKTLSSQETRQAKWANKVRSISPSLPLIPPKIDSEVLSTVQEALFNDEQLDVDYRSLGDEEPRTRRLHPFAIVNCGAVTYLIASSSEHEDVHSYAIHRVSKATRIYEAVIRPEGFDLDEHIQSGGLQLANGKTIRLKANIPDWLARILEGTPLSEDQKLEKVGEFVKLTATVSESQQLEWWILSYGSNIEVISPVSLRRKIGGMLAEAARQYE